MIMHPLIVVTTGEPAGIGFDIVIDCLQQQYPARIAVIGDPLALETRAQQLKKPLHLHLLDEKSLPPIHQPGHCYLYPIHTPAPVIPGVLDKRNSAYVLACLDFAIQFCQRHQAAMVTGPLHKKILVEAGFENFTGHTDYLAKACHVHDVVMMLTCKKMRVALATTHIPLKDVTSTLTTDLIIHKCRILHHDLQHRFGIENPRILIAGCNPHAGEAGLFGREEIEIIEPAVKQLQQQGFSVIGPLPADTLFTPTVLAQGDVVLSLYHDQGLPVIKYASFGETANITLGLPIIRTSVDHGTALTLAGTNHANADSLNYAIKIAIELVEHENHHVTA